MEVELTIRHLNEASFRKYKLIAENSVGISTMEVELSNS